MLEERADYWKWAPAAAQNDPHVQKLIKENVGSAVEVVPPERGAQADKPADEWKPPTAEDWLSGEVRPGAWFRGYSHRCWENPPLGLDHRRKVSVMRPIHQYVVSHVDAKDNLLIDRKIPATGGGFPALIFNAYSPHTISRFGRNCHECHGNAKAAGLGEGLFGQAKPGFRPSWPDEKDIPGFSFRWDALVDENGTPLQFSTHPCAGPLDKETLDRLMKPTDLRRRLFHEYLKGGAGGP
jgi:hypothetical protein